MPSLIYSFAQLEAFTAVAEHGSLAKAALKLGKDRTTLRDLIDFLEFTPPKRFSPARNSRFRCWSSRSRRR